MIVNLVFPKITQQNAERRENREHKDKLQAPCWITIFGDAKIKHGEWCRVSTSDALQYGIVKILRLPSS